MKTSTKNKVSFAIIHSVLFALECVSMGLIVALIITSILLLVSLPALFDTVRILKLQGD